jgi:type II secretory pathway pseudopilin PulG
MIDRKRKQRSGAALIGVLVAMGLLMAMISITMQGAIRNRREAKKHLLLTQAMWLCDAGLQRAHRKAITDPAYRSEHWQPVLPELNPYTASVQIVVNEGVDSISVDVRAELFEPNSAAQRYQRSLQHTFAFSRKQNDQTKGTKK